MWELIQENKRKSWILFAGIGCCLILLGYVVGAVWFPPEGGLTGFFIALCLWVILSFISYFSGDSIILSVSRAKEVSSNVHPQLFNVVEEMKISASLPVMPKIYIIDEVAPNAFAVGKSPENSAIAVTAGLLSRLNRDELQGVVAHEISHIMNRDVLYMTFAGVMLGSIVILSQIFLRSLWFSAGSSRRYRTSKGGGQAQLIIFIAAIVCAILAPVLARLFYFSLSRKREHLADASAVRLTRYPEGLASALEKISNSHLDLASANTITASMYIANPFKKKKMSGLLSTHPPIEDRIRILRSIAHGVNYADYQKAFSAVKGQDVGIMPLSALSGDSENIPFRQPSVEKCKEQGAGESRRDVGDLIRAVNNYVFLTCLCGLKIKIPSNFKKEKVACPRCGRELDVPLANIKAAAATLGVVMSQRFKKEKEGRQSPQEKKPRVYVKKDKGWQSFSCSCGELVQISPLFTLSRIVCQKCGRKTEIKS